jgi:hypothetical protein
MKISQYAPNEIHYGYTLHNDSGDSAKQLDWISTFILTMVSKYAKVLSRVAEPHHVYAAPAKKH